MKQKLSLLTAAGVMALSSSAFAEADWYGSLGVGAALEQDDIDFDIDGVAAGDVETDTGFAIQGAIGRHFEENFRAELELANRGQDVDDLILDSLPVSGLDGDLDVSTLMLNIYRDFPRAGSNITPYLGVGVGAAEGEYDLAAAIDGVDQALDDDDTVLAVQGLIGFAFAVSENIDLDLRYKHLRTDDFELSFGDDEVDADFISNELSVNLRSNFGAPPPPPPPPPTQTCWDGSVIAATADCPPEIVEETVAPAEISLTVYFDYDKSNLTPAAEQLISAKTEEARQFDITSVDVAGNTDSSGSDAYNNALSARRANVVRDALVANGVNGSLISVEARGESDPAKPTADGVREPLNRRVEVQYNF